MWPTHLPEKMEKYRNEYEHHWGIEMSDEGIEEAKDYFEKFFYFIWSQVFMKFIPTTIPGYIISDKKKNS